MAIITINGTAFSTDNAPSKMSIGLYDVSNSDSGRDQNGLMYKNLVTRKYKIELEWWGVSPALTSQILTAIDPEYFSVSFTDPKTNSWVTKTMYVGDRSAPYQMWGENRKFFSKVSFNLIER